MDKLAQNIKLPLYREGEELEPYLRKLVFALERKVHDEISKRINYLLDSHDGQWMYFTASNGTEVRIGLDDDAHWNIQLKVDGTWTMIQKVSTS